MNAVVLFQISMIAISHLRSKPVATIFGWDCVQSFTVYRQPTITRLWEDLAPFPARLYDVFRVYRARFRSRSFIHTPEWMKWFDLAGRGRTPNSAFPWRWGRGLHSVAAGEADTRDVFIQYRWSRRAGGVVSVVWTLAVRRESGGWSVVDTCCCSVTLLQGFQ